MDGAFFCNSQQILPPRISQVSGKRKYDSQAISSRALVRSITIDRDANVFQWNALSPGIPQDRERLAGTNRVIRVLVRLKCRGLIGAGR